jgi:hypothetical protein
VGKELRNCRLYRDLTSLDFQHRRDYVNVMRDSRNQGRATVGLAACYAHNYTNFRLRLTVDQFACTLSVVMWTDNKGITYALERQRSVFSSRFFKIPVIPVIKLFK